MCWPLINGKPFHEELAQERRERQSPRLRPDQPNQHQHAPMPRTVAHESSLGQKGAAVPGSKAQGAWSGQNDTSGPGSKAQGASSGPKGASMSGSRAHGASSAQRKDTVSGIPAQGASAAHRELSAQKGQSAQTVPSARKPSAKQNRGRK